MRRPARKYDTQTVLEANGFTLADLNEPIPTLSPEQLREELAKREVQCEYPSCGLTATTMLPIRKHLPFLCDKHEMQCTIAAPHVRAVAVDLLLKDLRNQIGRASFPDYESHEERAIRRLSSPFGGDTSEANFIGRRKLG